MKEDEYETNKRLKGFLNVKDKKEIQKYIEKIIQIIYKIKKML